MEYKMNWQQLLSGQRAVRYPGNGKKSRDLRTEFEKDYHRIIGSASFRRLQDKTQVFALDKSDFIRTRLTHSLEVSSFARSLGQNISQYLLDSGQDPQFDWKSREEVCSILQSAGLIHDIGNPPFGHFGEEAIRDWFVRNLPGMRYKGQKICEALTPQMAEDFYQFEGNAQALRLVSKLHFLVNEYGMNLTLGVLGATMKYPTSSLEVQSLGEDVKRKKMGYFHAEEELYKTICRETGTGGFRNPLSYILEAADDIAYLTADVEDAFKKGFLSYDNLSRDLESFWKEAGGGIDAPGILRHQYEKALARQVPDPRLYAVQNWVVRLQSALIFCATDSFVEHYAEIMNGTMRKDLFADTDGAWLVQALGKIAHRYAFSSRQILQMEVSAGTILNFLLDRFVHSAVYYDTDVPMDMMAGKLMNLVSENYKLAYHTYAQESQRRRGCIFGCC